MDALHLQWCALEKNLPPPKWGLFGRWSYVILALRIKELTKSVAASGCRKRYGYRPRCDPRTLAQE